MTDRRLVAHNQPQRGRKITTARTTPVRGPEIWRRVGRDTWTHWDRWFLVAARTERDGLDGVVSKLEARPDRGGFLRDDTEAKVAGIADLRRRLADAGINRSRLIRTAAPALVAKARRKVFEQEVSEGAKTPAMRYTPRRRLQARAHLGCYEVFPCSPAAFEGPFLREIASCGHYGESATMALVGRLDRMWCNQKKALAGRPAELLALHRSLLAAILVAIERADDSSGMMGELFGEVLAEYAATPWEETGVEPEAYLRDMIELGVWEDYGFTGDLEIFFKALDRRHGPLVEKVFASIVPELRQYGLGYQIERALALRARFLVMHRRYESFLELATEIGSNAWQPIVSMAEAAWKVRKKHLALAVFAAANVPGRQREYLLEECRRVAGRDAPKALPPGATMRLVEA